LGTPARLVTAAMNFGLTVYATLTATAISLLHCVHVPGTLREAPRALVLVLHGGGGIGPDVTRLDAHPLSVFRKVADREGLVAVYPAGLPARDGRPGWVDCRGDERLFAATDDVGFLAALIERLRVQLSLPPQHVFMVGSSNGAMMTFAFAMARPDLLGAAATAGGSLAQNPRAGPCAAGPQVPVPMMLMHGTADAQMPYEGGCVANLGGACNRGRVISAEATRDRWLQANGLTGVVPAQQVVERDDTDGGSAQRFDYAGAVPLRWWRLDGAGHTVASRAVAVPPNRLTGMQNRDVEFAEVAWEFFEQRLAKR
jgi:polyhydroxybutyrate depolymerase